MNKDITEKLVNITQKYEEKYEDFLKQFPENNNFLLCDFVKLRNATNNKEMKEVINEFIRKRFKELE